MLTRSRLLRSAGGVLLTLLLGPAAARATKGRARSAPAFTVANGGPRYAGDRPLFATVSPGVPGRDTAVVRFNLNRPADVTLEAVRAARHLTTVAWQTEGHLPPGLHEISWTPDPATPVGSWVIRPTLTYPDGSTTVIGTRRPASVDRQEAPVVRVLGVEASFLRRSYTPGEQMELQILADAPTLTLQFLRCGAEDPHLSADRNDELVGALEGDPVQLDWTGKRSAPATITVQTGAWPSGVYAARLTTDDGRVGFAPFVLLPQTPGAVRQLVVIPTNTWQAYNMYDRDGDGWGDTWYAGGNPPVALNRPYRDRGVPPHFKSYDRAFLRWLARTGKRPDVVSEDDLEAFASGDDLRALYDLVVFPGHSEYETSHAFDVVERYRDLGGRLIFLSADNFFWRVDKDGDSMRRITPWRSVGRPEAGLCGAEYRANDGGTHQGMYTVVAAEAAPWLFNGTGLATGSTFGEDVGGFGIEIDSTTPDSPPGTVVLARISDLFGPGLSAEMSYYETAAGARVFAAGTLDFGGSVNFWPMNKMLDNLWQHMLEDVPPIPQPPPQQPQQPPPAPS